MAKETSNYGFTKPEINDFYDVNVQNNNWDKLDTKMKELDDGLDAELTKITYGTTDLTAGTSELETGKIYLVYE